MVVLIEYRWVANIYCAKSLMIAKVDLEIKGCHASIGMTASPHFGV